MRKEKREKMNLGTLIEWEEVENPNWKACWSLRDTFAVFIRDYLYEFAKRKKWGYPPQYADMEEWNAKILRVADNFALGIADTVEEEYKLWCESDAPLEEKEAKTNEINGAKARAIEAGFDGLKEIFWDLWD